MKFRIVGKDLEILAENLREIGELVSHYRLELAAILPEASGNQLMYYDRSVDRDNTSWFEVEASLGREWIEPYLKHLKHLTGFDGEIPEMPAPRYPQGYCEWLCHTHLVTESWVSSQGCRARGFVKSRDWMGRKAADRAQPSFEGYLQEDIGKTPVSQQYIPVGSGGLYQLNPNFGRYKPPIPVKRSEDLAQKLWEQLFQWWRKTQATPEQQVFLDKVEECHHGPCPNESLAHYLQRSLYGKLRTSFKEGAEALTLEEFQRLGKPVSA